MKKFDILIIGGGPAAITIAKIINNRMKVGMIRPEAHSMVYCAMPYAIEKILPIEKTLKSDSIVTDTKAELIRDKVVQVNFENKTVTTEKNGQIAYSKLVIATGAEPLLPKIEGREFDNVMTFKTEKDLKKIMEIVDNGLKEAVVVGSGAIGIELAQALNERKVETHLFDFENHVLPNMIDEELSSELQESLNKSGINLHLNSKVNALKGEKEVEEIIFGDNKSISFSKKESSNKTDKNNFSGLVIFNVGMRPHLKLFENTNLNTELDGIIVNNKMETNITDVYAVGDCCHFISAITGKGISGKLATNAVPMARVLAHNLLGDNRTYAGFYNGVATKVNEYFIGSTGFTEKKAKDFFDVVIGRSELTTIFPIMPKAEKVKLKLIADKKTHQIVGGQIISKEPVADKIDKITMAIQYGIKVEELANFSYSAQPYQSFYPANNIIVQATEQILKQL